MSSRTVLKPLAALCLLAALLAAGCAAAGRMVLLRIVDLHAGPAVLEPRHEGEVAPRRRRDRALHRLGLVGRGAPRVRQLQIVGADGNDYPVAVRGYNHFSTVN